MDGYGVDITTHTNNLKKSVDFILNKAYSGFLSYVAPSSKGKRAVFDTVNLGSNPRGASIFYKEVYYE